jgi:uncharacterized protein YndB with AHSA1/START domain
VEINHQAPATAQGEIHIAADPQTVWAVISTIDEWPTWNADVKSARLEGPTAPGSVFKWKAGPSSLVSTLQVVERPREIGWTGRTMGITAVHVFRFEPKDGGTLARSEESWEGLIASLFKGYSRRTLDRGIRSILALLKTEAERRTSA